MAARLKTKSATEARRSSGGSEIHSTAAPAYNSSNEVNKTYQICLTDCSHLAKHILTRGFAKQLLVMNHVLQKMPTILPS